MTHDDDAQLHSDGPAAVIRVLLVDDSDTHVRALMSLFAAHRELVVVGRARTGDDGVSLGRRLTPDVVVLDLSLPDISGWKVAADLQLSSPRTRIVILSSHDTASHREMANDIGAPFVHKSQTARDLIAAVHRLAPSARGLAVAPSSARTLLRHEPLRLPATSESGSDLPRSTDLERTIAELTRSEERFRQITETIEEVFWLTDVTKEQMIYVSPAYARIWGRSCESLYAAPRSWLDAVHVVDRQRVTAAANELQASGEYDLEYRIVRPDGSVRWIRDKAYPLSDPDGDVYRVAGCAADVTQRRELEQRLEEGRMLEAVGRLAASIAHDFNNILMVIQSNASLLAVDPGLDLDARQSAEEIVEAVARAAALSVQLRAFSARHAHAANASAGGLDVGDAMTRLVRLFRRVLGADVVVSCHVGHGVPLIHAPANAMDQVMMNLLVNARDAMPRGGTIDMRVELLDTQQVRPPRHASRAERWVELSVRDTGDGIPAEHLPRVFDPLFTTKAADKGSGLGLATVDALVRSSGGWVEVESRAAVGTTFRVYWPVFEPSMEPGT